MPVAKILTTLVFVCVSLSGSGQKEASNWVFGDNIRMRQDAVGLYPDGVSSMIAEEGCASISDSLGNLLLYTNGITLYDRNGDIVNRGEKLASFNSCAQSAVFIKKRKNQYYLLTNAGLAGLYYSVIQVHAFSAEIIEGPTKIWCGISELMASCLHKNGEDSWLAVHQNEGNAFVLFLFSDEGITTVELSEIGQELQPYIIPHIQLAKFSPDGRFLAVTSYLQGTVELFTFNDSNGSLCENTTLHENIYDNWCYGVEFSSTTNRLYMGNEKEGKYVVNQFDLLKNFDSIYLTKKLIAKSTRNEGAMQLGLDGRIYITGENYIGAINDPDSSFDKVNYVDTAIFLGLNQNSGLGLPNFSASLFKKSTGMMGKQPGCAYPVKPSIFIPNIITPNGDGLNETLKITELCYPFDYFQLKVYNRYAQEVFSSYDSNVEFSGISNIGSYEESELTDGVYYVVLKYSLFGQANTYSGTLTIIR